MRNILSITEIKKTNNCIRIRFDTQGSLFKYFSNDWGEFFADYFEDISSAPNSIAVIPFVTNVLPIIWLTDSLLELDELDIDFYQCINSLRDAYANMYPMLKFNGHVTVNKLIDNKSRTESQQNKVISLFSGGLDAYSTLIAHRKEYPHLITVGGADVELNNTEGWNLIKNQTLDATKEFGLPQPFFIESNFRYFLNERELDALVVESKDGWWHGFQHGIGLLGLTAPIAYLHNIKLIYIASSFWEGIKMTCASDPTIDNKLEFCGTNIIHDQYDCSRQQKIRLLSEFLRYNKKQLFLRVCWKSHEGDNCCKCEKCYRTIFGLLAEGLNPEDFGFAGYKQYLSGAKKTVGGFMKESPVLRICWREVKERYDELQIYKDDKNFNWIYNLRFDQEYSKFYLVLRSFYRSTRSLGGQILRICHLR